jgi:hypothetical protein
MNGETVRLGKILWICSHTSSLQPLHTKTAANAVLRNVSPSTCDALAAGGVVISTFVVDVDALPSVCFEFTGGAVVVFDADALLEGEVRLVALQAEGSGVVD